MQAYIYNVSSTLNNKVNYEKLYIELKASTLVGIDSVEGIKGKIYINVANELDESNKTILTDMIASHDGSEASAFDSHAIDEREGKIRELNQLAIYHPLLDNIGTVSYLTSIDNWINAYVRSGINNVLVAKIATDAQNADGEYFDYLHTTVNEDGNKTYEYFIAKIQGLI